MQQYEQPTLKLITFKNGDIVTVSYGEDYFNDSNWQGGNVQ